ncbi:hypothetical protein [Rathayibacter sp. VKM Ac-2857]|uniref:hypothetical protein n=1 Tax=Rathayibacter sp. VKM Ac-2857 TaxID=2739020 RepID=UPI001565EBBB|nr:hypothetical protein [Rathayibacter sp. VKM Ac-2857]NQX15844.1 hypothetical protein [Rathayibacter sp. VKM Ac-2857]
MKSIRMTLTAVAVCATALSGAPFAAASAAVEAPALVQSSGHAEIAVKRVTATGVTFDVGGGALPVKSKDGRIRITDGSVTSDALPKTISGASGRSVTGTWTLDDSNTVTFHFSSGSSSLIPAKGAPPRALSSDWGSKEWGHCVAGNGIGGAAWGGFVGAITGPGAIAAATGGLLGGIVSGAFTC